MEVIRDPHRAALWSVQWVRRLPTPRWPFAFRGLLPVLGLLAVALFAVTGFARNWIETRVHDQIRAELDATGHRWATLTVSGQQVRVSGAPPSADAGEDAVEVARATGCPTWLGPRTCAVSVVGAFAEAGESRRWSDVEAEMSDGVLTLSGELPREEVRAEIVAAARSAATLVAADVIDQLTVSGVPAPSAFDEAATQVAELASLCSRGVVALRQGTVDVRCLVERAFESELRDQLESLPTGVGIGRIDLLIAEEAVACEQQLDTLLAEARIEFATASASISPAVSPLLDQIADIARACPGVLQIEGHTDGTGNADANLALSSARAEAVLDALVRRGIPTDRLIAVGFGQSRPIADNADPEGRARNRRIEFRVTLDINESPSS